MSKSELEVILNAEEETVTMGRRHMKILPLNLWDIKDFEAECGSILQFMGQEGQKNIQISHAGFILWLSVRKCGIDDDRIEHEDWALSRYELLKNIRLDQMSMLTSAVQVILELSGLVEKAKEKEEGDSTEAPPSLSSPEKESEQLSPGEPSTTDSEETLDSPEAKSA